MYIVVWVRSRSVKPNISFDSVPEAKEFIAGKMNIFVSDLRFTEMEWVDEQNEIVIDYHGQIVACIIKGE